MAKSLYLIRHAKSDWSLNLPDFERPLNKRGIRDAPIMAKRLAAQVQTPELVITSPAQRALSTALTFADILAKDQKAFIQESDLYEADTSTWLHVINGINDRYDCVAGFGHNPGITHFTQYVTDKFDVDFPTCAIALITFDIESWQEVSRGIGTLVWFDYPKAIH
ncbi:histidine phosphatase family protein [Olivibacter sp. SDN3]|uniref:SixA phosphatase family protein n=1 Tax=Olivibacter sp. SDN3 TaxID=2764720 RepID=UPI00165142B3|nr:histidine phosphatase family protein [Olivibacter sp. SDN3]QNL49541.1 histidine phosphatase family protein [Olivibacter sp. SDN3]